MNFVEKVKSLFNKLFHKEEEKKDRHYLTGKEIRAIAKENNKVMFALEKKRKRKAQESEFLSEMKDPANILEVEDLHTYFFTDQGVVKAVNGVSFEIPQGSTVGIVGESGCGKSVTSMSIMQLLQGPYGQIFSGSIRFKSYDFKRDENGKPIPVWENDENGEPIYDPIVTKRSAKKAEGAPEPEWASDGNGKPIFDPVLAKKGNPKRDKIGNIIYARRQKAADAEPVLYERRQKRDQYGTRQFEMEEKVFDIAQMPTHEMYRL